MWIIIKFIDWLISIIDLRKLVEEPTVDGVEENFAEAQSHRVGGNIDVKA